MPGSRTLWKRRSAGAVQVQAPAGALRPEEERPGLSRAPAYARGREKLAHDSGRPLRRPCSRSVSVPTNGAAWEITSRVEARLFGRFASLDVMAAARGRQPPGWREGAGNRRSIACSVNRFVNRTGRDSSIQGRRSRRSEMGSVLSAEVTEAARDSPRHRRRSSYGS